MRAKHYDQITSTPTCHSNPPTHLICCLGSGVVMIRSPIFSLLHLWWPCSCIYTYRYMRSHIQPNLNINDRLSVSRTLSNCLNCHNCISLGISLNKVESHNTLWCVVHSCVGWNLLLYQLCNSRVISSPSLSRRWWRQWWSEPERISTSWRSHHIPATGNATSSKIHQQLDNQKRCKNHIWKGVAPSTCHINRLVYNLTPHL